MDFWQAGHVHGLLEHDDRHGNSWDPTDEGEDGKDGKDGKQDSSAPELKVQVVGCGADSKDTVEDARYPDKLFGECARCEKVCPRDNKADSQDKDEEDEGVCVEGEVVGGTIDAAAIERMVSGIALD